MRGIGVALIESTSTVARIALEGLLVLHAEALLLVDDHEPEVLQDDVALQEAVGADQDVHAARRPRRRGSSSARAGERKRLSISMATG